MLQDLVTWLVIHVLQFGPLLLLLGAVDRGSLLARPNLLFWLAVSAALWIGNALGVMAFGAAGSAGRLKAAAVHLHVRGFVRAGGDAVKATNAVFVVGALVLIARFGLEETVPYLGGAMSSTVGAYWLFTQPHLSGLVFRRHPLEMEELYEGRRR